MQPKVPQDIIEEIVWCIDRESSDFSATLRVWRSVSLGFRRAADAVLFHDVHLDTTTRQQDDWTPRTDRLLRMAGKNRHIPRLVRRLQITIPVSGERVMERDIREVRSFLGVIELRITVRGYGSRTWSEHPTYKTKFCKGLLAATDLQRLELEELQIPMNVLLACSRLRRLRLTRASVTEVVESSMKSEPWSCLEVLDLFGSPVTVELLTALAVGSGVRELTYDGASSADPGDCNRLIDVLKGSLRVLKIASLDNVSTPDISGAALLEHLTLRFLDTRRWGSIPAALSGIRRLRYLHTVDITTAYDHEATELHNPWGKVDDLMYEQIAKPTLKLVVPRDFDETDFVEKMPRLAGVGRLEVKLARPIR
ncbi:hypothetical protein FPV67DRAFT_1675804 [Lyophyllum atratum]|nr:hypothetical protein FPV67DRAFT_1675804 [Lyophyllum atratum]